MITYEIKPPEPEDTRTPYEKSRDSYLNRERYGYQNRVIDRRGRLLLPFTWSKWRYSQFIEEVKTKYKVGDLVAYANVPLGEERPLSYVLELTYIEELYYNCPYDSTKDEPMCLTLKDKYQNVVTRGPSTMRKLTEKEAQLVHLQNSTPQGHA